MSEKTLKITLFDDSEQGETEHHLPAKFEVCARCEGYGTHLNPVDRAARLYFGGIRGVFPGWRAAGGLLFPRWNV